MCMCVYKCACVRAGAMIDGKSCVCGLRSLGSLFSRANQVAAAPAFSAQSCLSTTAAHVCACVRACACAFCLSREHLAQSGWRLRQTSSWTSLFWKRFLSPCSRASPGVSCIFQCLAILVFSSGARRRSNCNSHWHEASATQKKIGDSVLKWSAEWPTWPTNHVYFWPDYF